MQEFFPYLLSIGLIALNILVVFLLTQKSRQISRILTVSIVFFNVGVLFWQLSLININLLADTFFAHKIAFWAALIALNGAVGLAFSYPDRNIGRKVTIAWIGLIATSILLTILIFFTDTVVEDYILIDKEVVFGDLWIIYALVLSFQLLFMVALFAYRYVKEVQERYYFRYVFIAFGFYGITAASINFALPLFGLTELTLLGGLLAVIPQITITYTVISDRLHSIRYILNLLVLSLGIGTFLWFIFSLLLYLSKALSIEQISDTKYVLVSLIMFFVLPIALYRLQGAITNTLFNVYSAAGESGRKLIREVSRLMSTGLEIDQLLEKYTEAINKIFDPNGLRIHYFDMENSMGYSSNIGDYLEGSEYDQLLGSIQGLDPNILLTRRQALEIVENNVKEIILQNNTQILITLGSGGDVKGFVFISAKEDLSPYTIQDIEVIESLSLNLSVALERALLYGEVVRFNKKLQTEVATATTDLKIRNKRLTILRELDQIIMNTLEVDAMSQKIVDLVSWEMGLAGALMVLLEEEPHGEKYLRVGGLSSAPIFERALKILPKGLKEYRLPFGEDPSNLFFRSITDRKPFATDTFRDLYVPPLSLKVAETLQNLTHTEHMVVYPLSAKGRPLGAISFGLNRSFAQLSNDEKELLEAFMDEAGIAIENARLYAEIQQRNDELKDANERLLQLDKMKDELVSVASHELRTPMTAIKSYIWMGLNKQRDNLTPDLQKYLERAYISSDRMINLVNDMLSASRLEGGRVELDIQAHDVVPIITEIVEQLIPKANEQGLKLTFTEPKKDIPLGLIDDSRYREILYNLIGNSVKYTDKGSIKVTVSAHVGGSPSDEEKGSKRKKQYLWVEVTDTGRGIDKEDLPRLFKKFSKLEQGSFTKTAESGGTGLGLYITKGLVELHGGTIWVDSKGEGKGSVFGFSVRMA